MDFLLLTRAAGVLPAPRSYCHNRTRNDSRAAQPPETRSFVLFWCFFFFPFRKLLSLSSSMTAFSDTFVEFLTSF